ncbi:hypothetical protein C8J57DRAFT_1509711 [Mycena rebaudengoi]|nr:hypothetical protein C8J57DRAFT_1509711 [Mycena rebaudengoi]
MASDISASFPPELEREIFEIAATQHPEMMPRLVRVARRVLVWYGGMCPGLSKRSNVSMSRLEPQLYQTVMIRASARNTNALLRATRRQPEKFAQYVERLLIIDLLPDPDTLLGVLSVCTGVRRLALFHSSPTMRPLLEKMQLYYLSTSSASLFGNAQAGPVWPSFPMVTHLDLHQINTHLDFAGFPALTHLCLRTTANGSPVPPTVLYNCNKLQVLINMYCGPHGIEGIKRIAPPNLPGPPLFIMRFRSQDYFSQLAGGANGVPDFWDRVERFAAKKRRGEIQPGLLLSY